MSDYLNRIAARFEICLSLNVVLLGGNLCSQFDRNYSRFREEEPRSRGQVDRANQTILIVEDEKRGASMIDVRAIILMFLLILGDLEAITVVNHHPDDEYVLEHEVLREDALAEAKKLEIYPGKKSARAIDFLE